MQQAQDVVEKVIKPWLEKHHPNADIVIMAGSFGRAMKNGSYQPIASSDVDLVIIYSDLEKGGFHAATQIFTMEEVGTALGEAKPRIMMIDTNIHDLASLHYHDKVVKENSNFAFMNVMIDEGYVLMDKLGIAPVLQQKAATFLEEGPAPTPRGRWQGEVDRLETYLSDIRSAPSVEEKRFLGTLALIHTCEYALGLHQYWRSGSNQAYRRLSKYFPQEEQKITEAFSALMRHGAPEKVEALLEDYIARGRQLLPTLPAGNPEPLYPAEKYLPAEESAGIRNMFLKFMTEHLTEALETSQKRGELAWLENLSATLHYTKMSLESRDGDAPTNGRAAMHYLAHHLPDALPVTLQALDEGLYQPVCRLAETALAHMGGLHYTRLENYYEDDVARRRAAAQAFANDNGDKPVALKATFKPKFTP